MGFPGAGLQRRGALRGLKKAKLREKDALTKDFEKMNFQFDASTLAMPKGDSGNEELLEEGDEGMR